MLIEILTIITLYIKYHIEFQNKIFKKNQNIKNIRHIEIIVNF